MFVVLTFYVAQLEIIKITTVFVTRCRPTGFPLLYFLTEREPYVVCICWGGGGSSPDSVHQVVS